MEKAAFDYAGTRRSCSLRIRGSERGSEWPNKTSDGKPDGNWGAPDGTDAVSAGVHFPCRPRKVGGWVSISSDVSKECRNVGIRKDSLKAFLGSMWWDYHVFDANLGF